MPTLISLYEYIKVIWCDSKASGCVRSLTPSNDLAFIKPMVVSSATSWTAKWM